MTLNRLIFFRSTATSALFTLRAKQTAAIHQTFRPKSHGVCRRLSSLSFIPSPGPPASGRGDTNCGKRRAGTAPPLSRAHASLRLASSHRLRADATNETPRTRPCVRLASARQAKVRDVSCGRPDESEDSPCPLAPPAPTPTPTPGTPALVCNEGRNGRCVSAHPWSKAFHLSSTCAILPRQPRTLQVDSHAAATTS